MNFQKILCSTPCGNNKLRLVWTIIKNECIKISDRLATVNLQNLNILRPGTYNRQQQDILQNLTPISFTFRISLATVQICLLLFFIIFLVFPLIFRYSITLQRGILFLTFSECFNTQKNASEITYPKDLDLSNPASVGNYATRSFYITVQDGDVAAEKESKKDANEHTDNGVRIGVWHVLPRHLVKRFAKELQIDNTHYEDLQANDTSPNEEQVDRMEPILKSEFPIVTRENEKLFYERLLKLPGTIVIYLHGNTASRGSGHRNEVYKLLRNLGYHVITFDYRGYGDSDSVSPTEEGVVRDAMAVYHYVSNLSSNPIIIWGHSLGTGVATNLCAQLNYMQERGPRGVILEAPFTNIHDEIRQHPFARPFKNLPWFDMTIARPMYTNSLRFESDQHISEFRQPIMIIHAEDDYVVPFQLGYKLYRTALDTRGKSWGPVEFHRFDASHQYGHKYLCRAPELPQLIKSFVENYRNEVF